MTDIILKHPALAQLTSLSAQPPVGQANLLGCTLEELSDFALACSQPSYRGKQLFEALFKQRVKSFEEITNLPKAFRAALENQYVIERPKIDQLEVSQDGTRKYRFVGVDGLAFESVYIPEVAKGRKTNTLCVSSQTGCAVGCGFCYTASLRRNRNLAAAEIVGQVLAVQDDVAQVGESAQITNIVYMGMGEPLLNYRQLVQSVTILLAEEGAAFSSRRITISTSGIVPRIYDLGKDLPTQLAISLNATTDETRTQIMPINKKWPLNELIEALRQYPLKKRRRFTIEYVLLAGVNDTNEDAKRLIELLKDLPVKINLLPLNDHERTKFSSPSRNRVYAFQKILKNAGMNVLLRTPRGNDISAACGQLGETISAA